MNKNIFSFSCAIAVSLIWGSAFIAQDMGMDFLGPFGFTFGRLILGFFTLLPFFIIFDLKKVKEDKINYKKVWFYALFIGFLLSSGNILQQFALLYTDVANTAVFTILYVVIVPFVGMYFYSKKIHWSVWPAILICVFGSFLLTEIKNVTVRLGDSIAVVNAFFWAFHIVFISKFVRFFNFPITIAMSQCLIGALIALIPALIFEDLTLSNLLKESKEMIYAGVLSSGVAFLLQVYSQQNLNPAPVAIIFTLEGVWAALFGWILLDQYLNSIKILGIIMILGAVIFSQLSTIYGKKSYGN
jgi:drug/metabolite transporter (DMT)-like permease